MRTSYTECSLLCSLSINYVHCNTNISCSLFLLYLGRLSCKFVLLVLDELILFFAFFVINTDAADTSWAVGCHTSQSEKLLKERTQFFSQFWVQINIHVQYSTILLKPPFPRYLVWLLANEHFLLFLVGLPTAGVITDGAHVLTGDSYITPKIKVTEMV